MIHPQQVASPPAVIHVIDTLAVGGRQMLLCTVLHEALRTGSANHRVVSLFGDGPMGQQFRDLGIPVDVFQFQNTLSRRPDRAVKDLQGYFRKHQPEIVEAHLTYSRLIGLFAAWRAGIPVRIAFEPGDIYLTSWTFRTANFLGQFLAHRIVPCSYALAEWNHRTHGILRRRMTVIHNCVDLDRFSPTSTTSAPAPFERPACETLYCAIGTLGTGVNKRVDVILRAVAGARASGADVGLVVVGDGPLRAELESLTAALSIEAHVRFLGTRTDTPAILAACDALCHASPFEPFGIVAIEAMAMGLPIVVPESGGIREIVEDGTTGLSYPPLDHRALAGKMVQLHHNPSGRERMGRRAREVAETRFSPSRYLSELQHVIDTVKSGARKGHQ